MKSFCLVVLFLISLITYAQPERIKSIYPAGTTFIQNVPYANDTLKKHLLDIYLPPNAGTNTPLIIWIHGGGWMVNDKYADMSYMKATIRSLIESGYAIASIDYRHSTTAIFPAQIHDLTKGISFLYENASKYKLDKNRFAIMGFSAGGHLGSLLALSLNNNVTEFYPDQKKPAFKIKFLLDFYGPSDFLLFYGNANPQQPDNSPVAKLLGVSPLKRPDLARRASPSTYVDKNDPPFFIVNGEKDPDVPPVQSYMLNSWLESVGVRTQLTIVKDAPHYGEMFDADVVRLKLMEFVKDNFSR